MQPTNPADNPISPQGHNTGDAFDSKFRPTGAIAFFIALVVTGLIIWFGIYFLMLERL